MFMDLVTSQVNQPAMRHEKVWLENELSSLPAPFVCSSFVGLTTGILSWVKCCPLRFTTAARFSVTGGSFDYWGDQ